MLREARTALHELAGQLRAGVLQVTLELAAMGSSPADMIAARISESDVDFVVLGTQGRGAVERTILGSVAESVIHRAPHPVLVVHARR